MSEGVLLAPNARQQFAAAQMQAQSLRVSSALACCLLSAECEGHLAYPVSIAPLEITNAIMSFIAQIWSSFYHVGSTTQMCTNTACTDKYMRMAAVMIHSRKPKYAGELKDAGVAASQHWSA